MAREGREERRGFRVTGRVQGVGFRWWTRRNAQDLGLGGTVRNMPDGSVEVQAVGASEALRRLEQALRRGPPAARVEGVQEIPADPSTAASSFVIAS